ncbi:hypothetical protein VT84_19660 [Gemmata sp. SH-PL17]|nr:hypothetical protein VT84_19660 [Gemmata sp. SH-PL17]
MGIGLKSHDSYICRASATAVSVRHSGGNSFTGGRNGLPNRHRSNPEQYASSLSGRTGSHRLADIARFTTRSTPEAPSMRCTMARAAYSCAPVNLALRRERSNPSRAASKSFIVSKPSATPSTASSTARNGALSNRSTLRQRAHPKIKERFSRSCTDHGRGRPKFMSSPRTRAYMLVGQSRVSHSSSLIIRPKLQFDRNHSRSGAPRIPAIVIVTCRRSDVRGEFSNTYDSLTPVVRPQVSSSACAVPPGAL